MKRVDAIIDEANSSTYRFKWLTSKLTQKQAERKNKIVDESNLSEVSKFSEFLSSFLTPHFNLEGLKCS